MEPVWERDREKKNQENEWKKNAAFRTNSKSIDADKSENTVPCENNIEKSEKKKFIVPRIVLPPVAPPPLGQIDR